jgi:hypothetical protein
MFMSRGIERVSDSEVIVVAEVADRSPVSSETGGEGGNRLAGCWTIATMLAGEFRSNCCTVLLGPRVNKVAPGP